MILPLADPGLVIKFISLMHSLGGRVFPDDFGSGYSNYPSILGIRFDAIKIAGDLVKTMPGMSLASALFME